MLQPPQPNARSSSRTAAEAIGAAWRTALRSALILLLMVAFTALQSAVTIGDHPPGHEGSHPQTCPVCHASHLPILEAAAALSLVPPPQCEWSALDEPGASAAEFRLLSTPSRGPPA
jgi:hypothetical protein